MPIRFCRHRYPSMDPVTFGAHFRDFFTLVEKERHDQRLQRTLKFSYLFKMLVEKKEEEAGGVLGIA
jgi:hypothetical protein